MTTNQTIDGVPRERIKRLLKTVAESMRCLALIRSEQGHTAMTQGTYDLADECEELRALLDAPTCKACNDTGKMHEPGQEPGSCAVCRSDPLLHEPAAQPQGDTVGVSARWSDWSMVTLEIDGQHRTYVETCKPQGGPLSELEVLRSAVKELEAMRDARVVAKLAQGEPVATPLDYGSLDAVKRLALCRGEVPAPVAVVLPDRDTLRDIIAQAIGGDTYDCTRVWSAWSVGTMSEDDFVPVADQGERLYEIADACLDEVTRLNAKSR